MNLTIRYFSYDYRFNNGKWSEFKRKHEIEYIPSMKMLNNTIVMSLTPIILTENIDSDHEKDDDESDDEDDDSEDDETEVFPK